jgi:thioredoxin reductase
LPVAVIGAGPIGLAAAAHLLEKGETPVVFEAGDAVGASVRQWSHVRLFSPWRYLVDPAVRRLLEPTGWVAPDESTLPTGGELIERLLEPLGALPRIAAGLRLGHRVIAVTRRGFDKVRSAGRDAAPFELVVQSAGGRVERHLARAVIDASGTWSAPNPLGAGGVAAEGEVEHVERIRYGIPDVRGAERARYAGRRTLVVGSGHSAFNVLLELATLAEETPGSEITWAIRRTDVGLMFGGGAADELAARGALGDRLHALVDSGRVRLVAGMRVARLEQIGGALVIHGDDGQRLGPVDEIVVATGFRPDLALGRELRLGLDPWLEAPVQLAPLIDPNLHACGTVYPHGAAELSHPERDFYVAGMKSYGRAPTFLLLTGYEQVRSIACALVGDEAGARAVELVLPETGVCQTDVGGSLGGSCCAPAPTVGLARAPRREAGQAATR